jgi:hypothetical protein
MKFEEYAKQEPSMKKVANRGHMFLRTVSYFQRRTQRYVSEDGILFNAYRFMFRKDGWVSSR